MEKCSDPILHESPILQIGERLFENILAIFCLLRESQCEKEFSIFIMILTLISYNSFVL